MYEQPSLITPDQSHVLLSHTAWLELMKSEQGAAFDPSALDAVARRVGAQHPLPPEARLVVDLQDPKGELSDEILVPHLLSAGGRYPFVPASRDVIIRPTSLEEGSVVQAAAVSLRSHTLYGPHAQTFQRERATARYTRAAMVVGGFAFTMGAAANLSDNVVARNEITETLANIGGWWMVGGMAVGTLALGAQTVNSFARRTLPALRDTLQKPYTLEGLEPVIRLMPLPKHEPDRAPTLRESLRGLGHSLRLLGRQFVGRPER